MASALKNRRFGWHSGNINCRSITATGKLDLSYIGALSSGGEAVGANLVTTTAGTAGSWASAIYAKIIQGTTKNVNGYLCAAEFELAIAGSYNSSDCAVLVLNSTISNTGGAISHPAYIYIREYGSKKMDNLLWFGDATIGSGKTTLLSTTSDLAATHTVKVLVGTTPLWVLCNNVGP